MNRTLRKTSAALLSAALILLSPGTGCWNALAQGAARSAPAAPRALPVGAAAIPGLSLQAPTALPLGQDLLTDGVRHLPTIDALAVPDPAVAGQVLPAAAPPASLPAALPAAIPAAVSVASPKDGAMSVSEMLADPRSVALPAAEVAEMSPAEAHGSGQASIDRILGQRSFSGDGSPVPAGAVEHRSPMMSKAPPPWMRADGGSGAEPPSGPALAESGGGRFRKAAFALLRMAAAAGAVVGLHALAVTLLPALFGFVPMAALWAASSGALLAPVALYSRYRLALRDSPRLTGTKRALDLAIGAFLGAVFVTAQGLLGGGGLVVNLAAGLPLLAGVSYAAASSTRSGEGAGGLLDAALAWLSLTLLPPLFGVAGAAPLTLAAVFALMALPAMTTISFYLGRVIQAAESGRPFAVPGMMQAVRFPAYTWVMTGVVFALLTGYAPVWTNAAFFLWMFAGNSRLFGVAFLGAAVWAAASGFSAPITFLVLAFAPERAARWSEALLARLLPAGAPAPSTKIEPLGVEDDAPARWPRFHYWLKTGLFIGGLLSLGFVMGAAVFGFSALLPNLAVAAALAAIPFVFSLRIIKAVRGVKPADEAEDPEFFAIMRELRELINAERAAAGKKPIPMPEMVIDPDEGPNAYATGRSPNAAMVGVTQGIKKMTLDPEELRAGLLRLLSAVDPIGEEFLVFREAVRGTLPGVSESAGPEEVKVAVRRAADADLKKLGYRVLRGVIGHEYSHVMHRDMLLGTVSGALSSAISFASYGVLWGVGHARLLIDSALDRLRGRPRQERGERAPSSARREGEGVRVLSEERFRPEIVEPVTAGTGAIAAALWLAKTFAALWGPILATVLQMGSSRSREGHADESGAVLTRDPAALALGLGLLMSWRPPPGTRFDRRTLPRKAALAHIMTVNPIEQLAQAGLLKGQAGVAPRAVEREDDLFFNLFITHPDTKLRIRRLYAMARAMGDGDAPGGAFLDGGAPPAAPLRAAAVSERSVDPDSNLSFMVPGTDERFLPVIDALRAGIEKDPKKLGHLAWALERLIAEGGVVRYAEIRANNGMAPSSYDAATRSLYINQYHRRTHPTLQAAVLAATLQKAYDDLAGNSLETKESWVRQILAQDAFLSAEDPSALAARVDINNTVDVELFKGAVENRLSASLGFSALNGVVESITRDAMTMPQILQKAVDHQSRLASELRALKGRLDLVERGLGRRQDAATRDNLLQDQRVLQEKIAILEGNLKVAEVQIAKARLESERARGGSPLDTPLSVNRAHRADLAKADLKVVRATARPLDPGLEPVVELLRTTVSQTKDPAIRGLSHLVGTLERLLAQGGRVRYAAPGDDAAAYFDPVTLDLVIGRQFMRAHPALVAALLVHELTHADDYFLGRALTRETERNAFTNEAIFIGAFDPRGVAARIDPLNRMERLAYDLVYHARTSYLEGNTSLQAMISHAYTTLFGAHMNGLFSARQLLESIHDGRLDPTRQAVEQLERKELLLSQEVSAGTATARRIELEQTRLELALRRALLVLYERQAAQLERAAGDRPGA